MILERLANGRYSRVLPVWQGRTVVILGGGPSLTGAHFKAARRARQADRIRAIAVNDSYLHAPWADVDYAADVKWHRWHTHGLPKPELNLRAEEVAARWKSFAGQKCSIEPTAKHVPDAVHILRNREARMAHGCQISRDPEFLFTGYHGGFQALNIAVLAGARTVLLLGFDARRGSKGEAHWHGDHPVKSANSDANYARMIESFDEAAADLAGVLVVNCSFESAITAFPKQAFESALAEFAP